MRFENKEIELYEIFMYALENSKTQRVQFKFLSFFIFIFRAKPGNIIIITTDYEKILLKSLCNDPIWLYLIVWCTI